MHAGQKLTHDAGKQMRYNFDSNSSVKFPLLITRLSADSQYQQNRNFNFNRRHLVEF